MDASMDQLVDTFLRERWEEYPVLATAAGVDGYDDEIGDHSAAAWERREERVEHWIRTLESVPDATLSLDEQIDRDLMLSALRGASIMRGWSPWRRTPDLYLGACLQGAFSLFLHRLRPEPELAASAATRLRRVPEVLEHAERNIDPSLAAAPLVERAIGMARAGVAYARLLVPAEVTGDRERALLADAGEVAAQAFERFAGFLQDLKERAKGDWAIGEERYDALLREKEMLGYGAREMRTRGEHAYAELEADLRERARAIGGTDDWRAVMEQLNQDAPKDEEEMRALYEEWTERARAFLIERELVTLPDGERCLVEPSPPFQRPMLAVASYMSPPAFKPSLTGHFFVPYAPEGTPSEELRKRLQTNSRNSIPTTSVHEAYPGHHWHLTWAQSNPRPIRRVLWTSYFVEGWALYTEVMMREEGFFTDPRHEMAQVDARIFRAARMIVDTSLHTGEMTIDEATRFMSTKASLTEPTARAEVLRYCSWPTQAPSYLTGSLEIERMRERYLREKNGTLRGFHDTLAGTGGLPIALAERALMEA